MKAVKRNLLSVLLLAMFVSNLSAQVSFGKPEKINDGWKFRLGDVKDAQSIDFDADRWRTLDLPHDWSIEGTLSPSLASCTGYLPGGIGWYRKTIDIPQGKAGDKVYIYFEGVYNRSEVFVNGHSVGVRPNGYVAFMYDITPYVDVEAGKEAVIAVRVDHSRSADSRWYTGSGIYRNVWLITAGPVHIAQWGVFCRTKSVDRGRAVLTVDTEIANGTGAGVEITVIQQLLDARGVEVTKTTGKLTVSANSKGKTTTDLTVRNPLLWSVKAPNLYRLKTTVQQGGRTIDECETTVGIRTFAFDPNKGFALNGEWMKMKGVCIHHDAGVLGSAVPREVWERRLLTLKEIGVNAIRLSHNPQAPDVYELCDKLGLLVMDEAFDEWEFPKRKWLEGWNVGKPGFEGSYDFFEEWGERDLADIVRRGRNHPSIFAWSIGNEVDYPNDPYSHPVLGGEKAGFTQATYGGYKPDAPDAMRLGGIAKRLVKVVKEYDNSRPTTAGLAGVAMSNATEYPTALDIAGYNYTEDRYDADHKTYPNRVIYGSENRHDMAAWKAVRDKEFIFGQFLWTGIDYLGESHAWPTRGFYSGLLNLGGFIKPRGHFRQALWSEKPVAYLGTYPAPSRERGGPSQDAWPIWNYTEGQNIRVVCYTNAAKARLLLNGTEVGATKDYDDNTGVIWWDVPYATGTLEVEGMNAAGNKTCSYAIRTSARPQALTAKVEHTSIANGKGLAQITVQIVDENGIPVALADDEITCIIEGPAKLLGLEASNNADMTNYRDNVHRAFRGQILAYVQATGEGNVTVKFTAPWLKPVEVKL